MDRDTFTSLVSEARASYYRVAVSILRQEQDAEDAVQNGLLKAYQKRNQLKDIALFRTWSTRIIIHECYRLRKKERKEVPLDEAATVAESPPRDPALYEAIRALLPNIQKPVDCIFIVNSKDIFDIDFKELRTLIRDLLKEADII